MKTRRRKITLQAFLFLAGSIIIACSPAPEKKPEPGMSFDSLTDRYYEDFAKLYPVSAMLNGDNRYNDVFVNDLTSDFRSQRADIYAFYDKQLSLIGRGTLTEAEQVNYDIIRNECEIGRQQLKFNYHLVPVQQMSSVPMLMGMLASGSSFQPFNTVQDYDNWLKRLRGFSPWIDTAIVNMKEGIAKGYVQHAAITQKTIPQMESFAKGPVENHLFMMPLQKLPSDISPADKERLTTRFRTMVSDTIIPAYARLTEFLRNEYLPASRKSAGIGSYPDGREWYAFLIKYYTTTDKNADEIFKLGESEVARIESEMEKIKTEVGFKGTLKDFFAHLRARKELMPYKKPEEVLADFNAIHERMKPQLSKMFNKVPKTPFEVRRTEAFREKSASAEYVSGATDGSRPGVFYVPIPDVRKYNALQNETLFLHEAIPGHHYQISLQKENPGIPRFRNMTSFTAYVEGWALYTESLGKELGLYTDPYQHFGNLSAEMHRAIRLVVDAGLHSKGWTREQAIQYSLDHEAEPEDDVIAEIERYMAIPGQALGYKIGQLKIIELRKRAEAELGSDFNIGKFHDVVLEAGSLPLNILETRVNNWITNTKNKKN